MSEEQVKAPGRGGSGRQFRFRALYLVPILTILTLGAWVFASPLGASPDDDYHLASIWCANAFNTTECKPGPVSTEKQVPQALHRAPLCYKFKPNVAASCQSSDFSLKASKTVLTSRGSFGSAYPPIYYATMGLFISSNILVSALVMRFVNVLIFVALTSALFVLLPRRRQATLVWSWLITTVPLGMFLIASNNPSAWAIIGVGSVWLALLGFFETTGRRKVGLGILFAVATLIAAGSRADSAIYAAISIVVVFVLTFRRERAYLRQGILPLCFIIICLYFYFSSGQSSVASTGITATDGVTKTPHVGALLYFNLQHVQQLWVGVFGVWKLGWLDTAMPPIVIFGALASAIGVVFAAISKLSWRKVVAICLVAAVLWLLPIYVLVKGASIVGESVQPRYLLPLIILLAGVALLQVTRRAVRFSRLQLIFVVVGLVVAQSVALHENMRRYISGADISGFNLNHDEKWWWHIPTSPMVVWGIGSLTYAALVVILVIWIARPIESDESPAMDGELAVAAVTD